MAEINDVLNPRLRKRAQELWRAYESGPPGMHHGHHIDTPFSERRANRVRELLPAASSDDVAAIVAGSYRYADQRLATACQLFAKTRALHPARLNPPPAPGGLDRPEKRRAGK